MPQSASLRRDAARLHELRREQSAFGMTVCFTWRLKMLRVRVTTLSLARPHDRSVSAAQQASDQAPRIVTLSGEMVQGYQGVQRNLAEAAEKMPEAHYGFKPTPEIRPFGQLVAHAALLQFRMCSMLKGEPSPRKDEKEDRAHETEAIALLKGIGDVLRSARHADDRRRDAGSWSRPENCRSRRGCSRRASSRTAGMCEDHGGSTSG